MKIEKARGLGYEKQNPGYLEACRVVNPCRHAKAQDLLGKANNNVQPSREAMLPALHPKRDLHGRTG